MTAEIQDKTLWSVVTNARKIASHIAYNDRCFEKPGCDVRRECLITNVLMIRVVFLSNRCSFLFSLTRPHLFFLMQFDQLVEWYKFSCEHRGKIRPWTQIHLLPSSSEEINVRYWETF